MSSYIGTGEFAPVVTDQTYVVSGARTYGEEITVGQPDRWGNLVVGITFYTGFAGCPARYYVTTIRDGRESTTIQHATGLGVDRHGWAQLT